MNPFGFLGYVLVGVWQSGGKEALRRGLTIPDKDIRRICSATGAPVQACKDRNAAFADAGCKLAEQLLTPYPLPEEEPPAEPTA